MKTPYKFAPARPGASQTHAELVKVYRDAGWSQADSERMAARDVERGRARLAVEKSVDGAGKDCRHFQHPLVQK
jgi:hypothetical protein